MVFINDSKEDTKINFNQTSAQIVNLVRGLNPNPVAYFEVDGASFKVFLAKSITYNGTEKNGTILKADGKNGLVIKTIDGAVEIVELTAPNSKRMLSKSYLNGKKMPVGSICNG